MPSGIAGVLYASVSIIIGCFMIGSLIALPLIWYHIGHVSKKLDKIIKLLESK